MPEEEGQIGLLTVELFLPESGSLKDKRRILKSIKDGFHRRYNVSVAELGYLDKWQRSVMGFCVLGNERRFLDSCLQSIFHDLEKRDGFEITNSLIEFL